jgi:hypothetical protein
MAKAGALEVPAIAVDESTQPKLGNAAISFAAFGVAK